MTPKRTGFWSRDSTNPRRLKASRPPNLTHEKFRSSSQTQPNTGAFRLGISGAARLGFENGIPGRRRRRARRRRIGRRRRRPATPASRSPLPTSSQAPTRHLPPPRPFQATATSAGTTSPASASPARSLSYLLLFVRQRELL